MEHHDYLDSPERIAGYLEAAFEIGDTTLIAAAIGDVARAKGMTEVARAAGVTRQNLYAALGEGGNPTLSTVSGVLKAMGLRLTAVALARA